MNDIYTVLLAKTTVNRVVGTVDLVLLKKQYDLLQKMVFELEMERRIRSDEVELLSALIALIGNMLEVKKE